MDLGSSFCSLTARSPELRPPMPFAATPPVSGPMKAILTVSLAAPLAGQASHASINETGSRRQLKAVIGMS
jgi:hypothetical protein